jgi:outer membrane biosynthesis protein TonB
MAKTRLLYHALVVLATLLASSSLHAEERAITGKVSEVALRSSAIHLVTPEFPKRAFQLQQLGVAVAEVEVDTSGALSSITILESPCQEIARALESAIRQSTFSKRVVDDDNVPLRYRGKLTYYFLRNKGKPAVYSVTDSFYVGRGYNVTGAQ